MSILVTGGCGYVGTALTQALLEKGEQVVIMDICPPASSDIKAKYVCGDITSKHDLWSIFEKSDIKGVFHVAGFGLAGTTNLPAYNKKTKKINVIGTQNVIEACLHFNVKSLVFTSTVNVVFQGKEIINGSEESHLWIDSGHLDYYSKTKHKAEKLVIAANGQLAKDKATLLRTCVLRLGGVYGPAEKTILQRSLDLMASPIGYLSFCHRRDLKIDFLHIDNAVQGHLSALNKLLENCKEACGEIFYLNDGNPSNLFFFLDPLYSLLKTGSCPQTFHMPPKLTITASLLFNGLSKICGQKFHLPFWGFTYMESYKINVNHYFSIEKARCVLGFEPKTITQQDWEIILQTLKTSEKK